MEGATLSSLVENEIVQIVIDDLTIVESDFYKMLAGYLDNFVDMAGLAGVVIIDAGIACITGLWIRYCLDTAQRGLMSMGRQRDLADKR